MITKKDLKEIGVTTYTNRKEIKVITYIGKVRL